MITAPPGWVLKEIRAGGVDVTDQVLPFGTADESLRDVDRFPTSASEAVAVG